MCPSTPFSTADSLPYWPKLILTLFSFILFKDFIFHMNINVYKCVTD